MVPSEECGGSPHIVDGWIMRRLIAIAAAGLSLAGCSSFSSFDVFKSAPPTVQVQLESTPPGADATTSLGPGCKTPCSVTVTPPETGFSVTYTMNKFQPDGPGSSGSHVRQLHHAGFHDPRPQSGGGPASARRPPTSRRQEEAPKTEAEGCGTGGFGVGPAIV